MQGAAAAGSGPSSSFASGAILLRSRPGPGAAVLGACVVCVEVCGVWCWIDINRNRSINQATWSDHRRRTATDSHNGSETGATNLQDRRAPNTLFKPDRPTTSKQALRPAMLSSAGAAAGAGARSIGGLLVGRRRLRISAQQACNGYHDGQAGEPPLAAGSRRLRRRPRPWQQHEQGVMAAAGGARRGFSSSRGAAAPRLYTAGEVRAHVYPDIQTCGNPSPRSNFDRPSLNPNPHTTAAGRDTTARWARGTLPPVPN